jgi:hypothetical protein
MEVRTRRGRAAEVNDERTGAAARDRWILAVGKRVDHRWLVEMSLGDRHRTARREATAAHAA